MLTIWLWWRDDEVAGKQDRPDAAGPDNGVYFSAFAGRTRWSTCIRTWPCGATLCHLMVMWQPLSWAYTFTKVPTIANGPRRGCSRRIEIAIVICPGSRPLTLLQFFDSYSHSPLRNRGANELSEQWARARRAVRPYRSQATIQKAPCS